MKDRPIIFNVEMVRAILAGRKMQTRRVMRPQPEVRDGAVYGMKTGGSEDFLRREPWHFAAPEYRSGDRLWLRESFCQAGCVMDGEPIVCYRVDFDQTKPWVCDGVRRWRLSIHMPRSASRITLEITGVRAERLQEISEADAKAEGVDPNGEHRTLCPDRAYRNEFAVAWNTINAKRAFGWDVNPWVWAISFRLLEGQKCTPEN